MRFDLEIPSTNNVSLGFIREGNSIPTSAIPLYYISINTKNKIPEDFISYETSYFPQEFISGGYEVVEGPSINAKGRKFLLTNVAKYSDITSTKTPMFYRHIIEDQVKENAIKVVDFYGVEIDKSEYLVEELTDTTNVYMNKKNTILYIEYSTKVRSYKKLLNLTPVFQEATWSDIQSNNTISPGRYVYYDGTIATSYTGTLYISYTSNTKLFRVPKGNIDDVWYPSILGADFKVYKNNVEILYDVPEYFLQQSSGDSKYRTIESKKCVRVSSKIAKSQYEIYTDPINHLYVYVYNYFTNKLKYAFTSNEAYGGTLYKEDIFYGLVKDYNYDGIIELPVDIDEDDVIYATHLTAEDYYEYSYLDLNTSVNNNTSYYAIYIKPYQLERAVYHAKIGRSLDDNDFTNLEDYYTFINDPNNNFYHISTISLKPMYDSDFDGILDVRSEGFGFSDKKEICRRNPDMIYYDLINGNLQIPSSDTLIAYTNLSRLVSNGYLKYSNNAFSQTSKDIIDGIHEIVNRNVGVSTHVIMDIDVE